MSHVMHPRRSITMKHAGSFSELFSCHAVSGAAFLIRPRSRRAWETLSPFIQSSFIPANDPHIHRALNEGRFILRFLHNESNAEGSTCSPVREAMRPWDMTLGDIFLPNTLVRHFWHLPTGSILRSDCSPPQKRTRGFTKCTVLFDGTQTCDSAITSCSPCSNLTLEIKPKWAGYAWGGSLSVSGSSLLSWEAPRIWVTHDRTQLQKFASTGKMIGYSGIDFFSGELKRVQNALFMLCMYKCKLFDGHGTTIASPLVESHAELISMLSAPVLVQSRLCGVIKQLQTWGSWPLATYENTKDVVYPQLPVLPIEILAPLVRHSQCMKRKDILCKIHPTRGREEEDMMVHVEHAREQFYIATTARDVSLLITFFTNKNNDNDDEEEEVMTVMKTQWEKTRDFPSVEPVHIAGEFGECWRFCSTEKTTRTLFCRLAALDFDSKTHKSLEFYEDVNKKILTRGNK